MSIDRYLSRAFNARTYNCAHLVCEVMADLKGKRVASALQGFLHAPAERQVVLADLREIRFLSKPESPCVVLMQSPRVAAHVGVWLRGRVLHLLQDCGVQFQPIEVATIGFQHVRYFTC